MNRLSARLVYLKEISLGPISKELDLVFVRN